MLGDEITFRHRCLFYNDEKDDICTLYWKQGIFSRNLFPESLIAGAKKDLSETLKNLGYGSLMMEENATPYGAVETALS